MNLITDQKFNSTYLLIISIGIYSADIHLGEWSSLMLLVRLPKLSSTWLGYTRMRAYVLNGVHFTLKLLLI